MPKETRCPTESRAGRSTREATGAALGTRICGKGGTEMQDLSFCSNKAATGEKEREEPGSRGAGLGQKQQLQDAAGGAAALVSPGRAVVGSRAQQLRCAGILTSLLTWFLNQQLNLLNVWNSSLNVTSVERGLGQARDARLLHKQRTPMIR